MNIKFSNAAFFDLVRLREFIAKNNPDAAQRVAQRLKGSIQRLKETPQIGYQLNNFHGDVREFIFGRYIVRYEIKKDAIYILRIWHGKEIRI